MRKEYDYSANNIREIERQFKEEMALLSKEGRAAYERQTKESLERFWKYAEKKFAEEDKGKVAVFDERTYRRFLEAVELLREHAETVGDRMVVDIKENKSFGYIKYFAKEIIHTDDECGDNTRQIFGRIFLEFEGMTIYPHGDEIEVMISQDFVKWMKKDEKSGRTKPTQMQNEKGGRLLRRDGAGRKKMC